MNGITRTEGHLLSASPLPAGWQIVATGDIDRDHFTDLVFRHDTTGNLSWFKLNGYSQVSGAALSPAGVANLDWKLRGSDDFDRDGHADLIWQNTTTGEILTWLMTGPAVRVWVPFVPGQLSNLWWRIVAPR